MRFGSVTGPWSPPPAILKNLRAVPADTECAWTGPEQAEQTVRWAEEVGLLNDRAYAAALVRHALKVDADEGAAISTLQASDLGAPVYESIGYKKVSRIQTWINPPRIPALASKEAD